jgi:hypothetical protein
VAADGVPALVGWILRVPDLTGAEVLSGMEVLAGAVVLAGAGVFSAEGVLGAGCSGVAGSAWPAEAGSGVIQTSGTAGPFPLFYAGALVACAGILSCPGAAGGRAGVGGILLGSCVHVDIRSRRFLLSPRVHVDVGGREILFRRRIVLRRGGGLVRRRRRCRRR